MIFVFRSTRHLPKIEKFPAVLTPRQPADKFFNFFTEGSLLSLKNKFIPAPYPSITNHLSGGML
jgi:hypothetical protein